jgi:alkyl hydroperoxide reductase subunit AhpC
MLGVGYKFPSFSLTATVSTDKRAAFQTITDDSYSGKWKVYFFWPKDFTFVCPTEIAAFGKLNREFQDRDAQLLGGSTDSEFVHLAWRQHHEDLKDLPLPHAGRYQARADHGAGHPRPERRRGPARHLHRGSREHHPLRVRQRSRRGRNPEEVLRVLDALQTDELCPCNWQKGEETIKV